ILVTQMTDQRMRSGPRPFRGLTDNDMNAQTEPDPAAPSLRPFPDIGNLLRDRRRWLAPGKIRVDMACRQFMGGLRGTTEVQWWPWLLHGGMIVPALLHCHILAV